MAKDKVRYPTWNKRFTDGERKPRVAILYHYMYPDDVISAQHLDGLAVDLAAMGWEVEALSCNRGCRDESKRYCLSETYEGVHYNRIWRPRFRQATFAGRLANSLWMTVAWISLALRSSRRRPDVVVIGTDPIFAVATAIPLKLFAPKISIAHWCFDLHPEAVIASGVISSSNSAARLARKIMRAGYLRCDIIVDIGPCMRSLLRQYKHRAREAELIPWALKEPRKPAEVDADTRKELFGDAKLAVLYSGNFGEAHSFEEILAVARNLKDVPEIHFCFAVRGNKADKLKKAIGAQDRNISFAGFASIEDLEKRLGAADIHMASLRPEWSGIAVPSKFFGSLAMGRPVLFAGPRESAIGQWIEKFDIGWVVRLENSDQIAEKLRRLVDAPNTIKKLQQRSHAIYTTKFSRSSTTEGWDIELKKLLTDRVGVQ